MPFMTDFSALQRSYDVDFYRRLAEAESADRQRAVRGGFDRARQLYQPGGALTQAAEAQLARVQRSTMAKGMQNLVNSGLAGTTMAGQLSQRFAEEVAAPQMLNVEAQRIGQLGQLHTQEAGAIGGMPGVSYGQFAQLSAAAAPRPQAQPQPQSNQPAQRPAQQPSAQQRPRLAQFQMPALLG